MHRSALLLALGFVALGGTAPSQDRPRPNVVIVLADDLGWADVGFDRPADEDPAARFYETPALDALARDGLVFERFYPGGPNCSPSRACIASGCYTPRHAVYQPGATSKGDVAKMRFKVPTAGEGADYATLLSRNDELPSSFETFGELLAAAGYATARIGKWHLGDDPQGFELATNDGVRPFPAHKGSHYGDPAVADTMVARALEFIEANRERPFVLYLSLWEVHLPLAAKQELVKKYRQKLAGFADRSFPWRPVYAAEIEVVDRALAAVRAKIEATGIAENTLVLFASDNGGLPASTTNAPLHGGKGSLFEGGIRVPAAAWWPGTIAPGRRTSSAVHGVDLLPTFCALAGVGLPKAQPVDGVSIEPLLRGTGDLAERALFWHYPLYLSGGERGEVLPVFGTDELYWRAVPASAITRGRHKLIHYWEYGTSRLFDLEADIGEQHDLFESSGDVAKQLEAELFAWVEATKAPIPNVPNPKFGK